MKIKKFLVLALLLVATPTLPNMDIKAEYLIPKEVVALENKAKTGDAQAQYDLGEYYESNGAYKTALKWYQTAYENGYEKAKDKIKEVEKKVNESNENSGLTVDDMVYGQSLTGVQISPEVAKEVHEKYEANRKAGTPIKRRDMWKEITENTIAKRSAENKKNFSSMYKRAKQGDTKAQNSLGKWYEWGEGVEKSIEEAVKWYRMGAEGGNALAQYNLGRCYEQGLGVEKNIEEAIKWYRKGAEGENARALFNLGLCYEQGKGVEKNIEEAIKWYKIAADNGDVPSQNKVEMLSELLEREKLR